MLDELVAQSDDTGVPRHAGVHPVQHRLVLQP
jgi:hypothetical protein